jgi:phosphonate transport system substrate-binding protein
MNLFSRINTFIKFTGILLLLLLIPSQSNAEISLKFDTYATDKLTDIVKNFRPIRNHQEKSLNLNLKNHNTRTLQVTNNHDTKITSFEKGDVDFSRFGPTSYIELKSRTPGIKLAIKTQNDTKRFKGVICTHEDSSIQATADLGRKTFAFANPRFTIGHYLSREYLFQHSIRAADLSNYKYLGRYDKVEYFVGDGLYRTDALKESIYNKLVEEGRPLRKLAQFPNVPKTWGASSDLDLQYLRFLKKVFWELKTSNILKPF